MEHWILKIDLSNRSYRTEEIPSDVIRKYIGGRGLGAHLLYNSVPARANPLGEENHLIFTAGPASGTNLFFSSKVNLTTKSPLTGIYLYTISSGTLGHQMRKAGLWAIDIGGISETPVYLAVDGRKVSFRDAASLWGMETAAVQETFLKEGSSPKGAATVAIGPAGERMAPFASVFCEGPLYRCFGRGGAGAVMGSKRLKGLVVAGNGDADMPAKSAIQELNKEISRLLKEDYQKVAELWRRYETAFDLRWMHESGILPTRNWQSGQFENWQAIDKSTTPMGWPEKGRPCGPYCPTPGCRDVEVKEGPYKGAHSDIEWETIYAFGSTCGVDKMEAVIAASQICDEYGIDTMSAGITIGFAMECFEKGLIGIEETGGVELRFGRDEAMIAMLRKIVKEEGIGRELAKGTRSLSRRIKGSEAYAMQVKGMELGGYECRGLNGQALQFAVNTRGGCHHAFGLPAREEINDDTRLKVSGKGRYVRRAAISRIVRDSMIVCTFTPAYNNRVVAEALSCLLGGGWAEKDLEEVGERIMCLERLFNMREGLSRNDDRLPGRLLQEPAPAGPTEGLVVPLEELKDDFYAAMGYDPVTGNPPDALLARLGIVK